MKKLKIIVITISVILICLFFNYIFSTTNINTNPKILILDDKDDEIVYLINGNKSNLITDINDKFVELLLFIEDKDFYNHNGFSVKRIFKSMYKNITKNTKEGASTITQQYIKNTYLSNEKTIFRKLKEIYLSIKIENQLDKNTILNEYLSCIYFGNNIYGIHNASLYYFNKNINLLTINEKISLIALLNAPSIYSNNLDEWNKKKNAYSLLLYENRLISEAEFIEASNDIILYINENYINSNKCYYIDQVMLEFNKLDLKEKFGKTVIIKTKYNKNSELIKSDLDINYSAISANKDGYITSIIGDKNYNKSTFNIAINGFRDIGSTIKPLLYYEAIKCGLKDMTHYSEPYSFKYNNEIINISNSSSNYYHSNIDMKTAIATSDNIYAVKTHLTLGMNTLVYNLKKYNIKASPIPSLALGSIGMSLIDLVKIYTQFFNSGYYTNLRYIESLIINDIQHNYKASKKLISEPNICDEIKDMLGYVFSGSIKFATSSSIGRKLKTKCYGKSGLTDFDSYMIGFNEESIVGVWSGDINNNPLINSEYKKLPKELFCNLINILN
jgi:membrane peptidoglycan carboxypeptidase